MNTKSLNQDQKKKDEFIVAVIVKQALTKQKRLAKFSPAWVVEHPRDAPGYQMELIGRIREGVKKSDWKQLISKLESTEKEFIHILPASLSSMQKKKVYSKEISERIYELARLFGLGYEVFDSKEDFKNWLFTPSKSLGNKKPYDLLDSSLGFEMVENEIVRIQYNVYS
jgi:putative toxin-antitoxin system antitoxin component (TIGR02293 family)